MRRSLGLALLLAVLPVSPLVAQVLDDALVPAGRLRLQMFPVYTSWDSRFGRTTDFVTSREDLGDDLTSPSAESLFPGTDALVGAIRSITGAGGYVPTLGETTGRVTKDITRIEFGGHLGVFDWLTVGVVLPWTRTRTNVDVYFRPDTVAGDLGLNPTATNASGVLSFLQALSSADAAAQTNAAQVCAMSPGTAACTSAQTLADRTEAFYTSASTAYSASPFFPIAGSATATDLAAQTASLDADLTAAGLGALGATMAFATEWIAEDDFAGLSAMAGFGVEGAPLGDVRSLWHAGDVEVSATVRLLDGAVRDSAQAEPRLSYRLLGTLLGRLPTGAIDDPDVFLDVGTGDGQSDLEGRLLGELTLGRHLGFRAGGRYGVQMSRTLVRRVAAPEQVLAPLSSRQLVEWNPGAYFGIEVAPSYRISPELSVGAEYWAFRKYRDAYTLTGVSQGAPVNTAVLEIESGQTVHQVGVILRYDSVARGLAGATSWPMQLHFRYQRAVAGGGGQTPLTTRVEFGMRLFRRFWGAP